MLYFHGNGEIVDDYDRSAPFYNEIGINLFVADYRGYGVSDGRPTMSNMIKDSHRVKLRSIFKPTLISHAEYDTIVPLEEGKELFRNSASKDKRLVIIPDADHNDLMLVGKEQYFEAIEEFIKTQ